MNRLLLAAALGMAGLPALAQTEGFTCLANHPEALARHLAAHPDALARAHAAKAELDARAAAYQRGGGGPYIIPVVFHVIHNNGPENISDEQARDAIRILNEDFNRQNPDWQNVRPEFLPIVADVGIEFRLAQRDPEGNCTNGITRTVSPLTEEGSFEMTQLIQWPRDRYMNVWVCSSAGGAAGYTYYPIWLDGWPEADGIVIRSDYLGSIGTSSPSRSRVLSHEVGHWLNLKHCWGDSNSPGDDENCFMDDDVEDTPLTRGWTSCVLSGASCGSALDNVQNYMEYAYCARMFTEGQAARMLAALTSPIAQRQELWQPANLAATGVLEEPILCLARFAASRRTLCPGGTVRFTDQSYNGVAQRSWSFPGGEPATSTDAQPEVSYAVPGLYPVTLVVSDGVSTLESAEAAYIRVLPGQGEPIPWSEGFEDAAALPNERWEVLDPGGDGGFAVTAAAAATGLRSARLATGPQGGAGRDELISTTLDLSGADAAYLTFRYAFARRDPASEDALYVWVSGNCGDTWVLRRVLRPATGLVTAGTVAGSFVPTVSQWRTAEIANIAPHLCTERFRLRFEFVSDRANDLFIDDINITASAVGLREAEADGQWLRVAVAPAGDAEALFELMQPARFGLELRDALGRAVLRVPAREWAAGSHRVPLPMEGFAPGAYLLRAEGQHALPAARFAKP